MENICKNLVETPRLFTFLILPIYYWKILINLLASSIHKWPLPFLIILHTSDCEHHLNLERPLNLASNTIYTFDLVTTFVIFRKSGNYFVLLFHVTGDTEIKVEAALA